MGGGGCVAVEEVTRGGRGCLPVELYGLDVCWMLDVVWDDYDLAELDLR